MKYQIGKEIRLVEADILVTPRGALVTRRVGLSSPQPQSVNVRCEAGQSRDQLIDALVSEHINADGE